MLAHVWVFVCVYQCVHMCGCVFAHMFVCIVCVKRTLQVKKCVGDLHVLQVECGGRPQTLAQWQS
jgi:hypothetical protein